MKRWCLKTLSRVPLLESTLGYKHLSPLTVFFHFNLLRSGLLPHLFASLPAHTDSLTDFVYIAANACLGLSTCSSKVLPVPGWQALIVLHPGCTLT